MKIVTPPITTDSETSLSPHKTCALGWYRLQLPGDLSAAISDNGALVKDYLVIGKGMETPPFILFHASALLGYVGSTLLVSETKSAIVVLGNTLVLQDAPNWVSSLLLETLLDTPEKNDYVKPHEAAHAGSKLFSDMFQSLEEKRVLGTQMKSPSSYIGKYYNSVKTWYFEIFHEASAELLHVCFGRPSRCLQTAPLQLRCPFVGSTVRRNA
jgi:hypothetical protein